MLWCMDGIIVPPSTGLKSNGDDDERGETEGCIVQLFSLLLQSSKIVIFLKQRYLLD